MLAPNAARATPAATGRDPRDNDQLGGSINPTHIPTKPICASLTGPNRCEALGIVATGDAPALALCRELLRQGINPDRALTIYRRGVIALTFRSIGEAARLVVETAQNGRPRFRTERAQRRGAAPPAQKNDSAHTADWLDWPAATDGGKP